MQIFFLSKPITILLCLILWPLLQGAAALLCLKLNDRYFSPYSSFYRSHSWEHDGRIYKQLFKVDRWKNHLPESGSMLRRGFNKRSLTSFTKAGLDRYLLESCRAEMTHWLAILPFWVFGFFAPSYVIVYMFIYAILFNVPFIIIQRYNRPRILKLYKKL